MVTQSQITQGTIAFVEAELLPAFDGAARWIGSAILDLAKSYASKETPKPKGKGASSMFGIVGADGMIDIDPVINTLKETARKHGKMPLAISDLMSEYSIPAMLMNMPVLREFQEKEFKLGEQDFEALRDYIVKAGATPTEG